MYFVRADAQTSVGMGSSGTAVVIEITLVSDLVTSLSKAVTAGASDKCGCSDIVITRVLCGSCRKKAYPVIQNAAAGSDDQHGRDRGPTGQRRRVRGLRDAAPTAASPAPAPSIPPRPPLLEKDLHRGGHGRLVSGSFAGTLEAVRLRYHQIRTLRFLEGNESAGS